MYQIEVRIHWYSFVTKIWLWSNHIFLDFYVNFYDMNYMTQIIFEKVKFHVLRSRNMIWHLKSIIKLSIRWNGLLILNNSLKILCFFRGSLLDNPVQPELHKLYPSPVAHSSWGPGRAVDGRALWPRYSQWLWR